MATLAKLVVRLVTDISEFSSGIQASAKKLGKFGDDMGKVGDNLTKSVTLPIVGAGVAALKFAADLNDAMDNASQVFGDSAKDMDKWAANAANDLGLSKAAALQSAVGFGQFLTAMGNTQTQAAQMSESLVGLAKDLGELNGVDASTIMDQLQSGLAGKAQGLKQYGIIMDDATLKAKALTMGIWDGSAAFSAATKSQAAYALIMEQTANVQGYYSKQTGDMGKSLDTLSAKFQNTMASFGKDLMPAAISFMDALTPILDWFNNLSDATKMNIVNALAFAAALGPVLSFGSKVIGLIAFLKTAFVAGGTLAGASGVISGIGAAFTGVIGPILAVAAAIALPITAMYVAYISIKKYLPMYEGIWNSIKTFFSSVFSEIGRTFNDFSSLAGPAMTRIFSSLSDSLANVGELLKGFFVGILTGITNAMMPIGDWIQTTFSPLLEAIGNLINAVLIKSAEAAAGFWQKVLQPALESVGNYISSIFVPVIAALAVAWQDMMKGLQIVIDFINTQLNTAFQAFNQLLVIIGVQLSNIFLPIWTQIQTLFTEVSNWISGAFNSALNGLQQILTSLGNYLSSTFGPVWDSIKQTFQSVWDTFSGFGSWISTTFNGALTGLQSIIKSIATDINNFANSINNLTLPDWLTPGSPTPFELGLRGISGVLKELANSSMPAFQMSLSAAGGPGMASNESGMSLAAGVVPAVDAIRSGGNSRSVSIGPIQFQGDLSESQRASLEIWVHQIFGDDMVKLLEGV